jgi:mono/diheme cytochrome c family protein
MRSRGFLVALAALLSLGAAAAGPASSATDADTARGRYLVAFGSCNDCHTPGWIESDGKVPVSRWLTGTSIGFRGPWGTVYPANVRLRFQQVTEDQWLFMVRTRGGHPPMKWTDLRALTAADQRAIYRFVRGLGPAGNPAPHDVPPAGAPTTPFYDVIPQRPSQRRTL